MMTKENTKVILHAEDEPAHAAIVRRAIQSNVDEVLLLQVENGREALDYLFHRGPYVDSTKSPRPDLIILDLRMPQISGLEVVAIVKKEPELQTIPVVILTTSDVKEDRLEAHTCGVDGYVTKPVDFDLFVDTIRHMCATWLQPQANNH